MKLLTKELLKKLPPLYSQEKVEDPMVIAKFFHPCSNWTWYAIEYDPEEKLFYGYVIGFENELGYFSLTELESIKVLGLGIERDLYFDPTPLSVIKERGY
jgi:hypothetical protein